MLRDMEDLLNNVYDNEIKDYLKEALKCYMGGSYRACVIMSVIAGVYDLHKKVKALAGSDPSYRNLDNEIERRKRSLEVYEKYLFEQCATEEIDMLNNSELKELQRCLDTRNDCAHPSNFICSPEKARDIYSSVIDILASKPVLFGFKHMRNLIAEMEERTFFPVVDASRMKVIICEKLDRFQRKAIDPFFKLLSATIKAPNSTIQKTNALRFLALSVNNVAEYGQYVTEFIDKDQYEGELLTLFEINIDILRVISDTSIEKIISKLDTNLKSSEINSINTWINIMLSERLQAPQYIENIGSILTNFSRFNLFTGGSDKRDIRYEIVKMLLQNDNCSVDFKNMLGRACSKSFTLEHYMEPNLRDILILLNEKSLYEYWLKLITENVFGYDFNRGNRAISVFKTIPKENWLNNVSDEKKVTLVEEILIEGTKEGLYYSHDCRSTMNSLHLDYPELTRLFVDHIFSHFENDNNIKYFVGEKSKIVSKYIVAFEDEIEANVDKLLFLRINNTDINEIIENIKNEVEQMPDSEVKSLILTKLLDHK